MTPQERQQLRFDIMEGVLRAQGVILLIGLLVWGIIHVLYS